MASNLKQAHSFTLKDSPHVSFAVQDTNNMEGILV